MSIDHGRPFDFGRVSSDYAKYRDIYPQELYRRRWRSDARAKAF